MIHHAVLGSLERFIGVLLEHHGLDLPFWLVPEQVAVLPVAEGQQAYADRVAAELLSVGLRAAVEGAGESLPRRIVATRERGVSVVAVVVAAGYLAAAWRSAGGTAGGRPRPWARPRPCCVGRRGRAGRGCRSHPSPAEGGQRRCGRRTDQEEESRTTIFSLCATAFT